jgi:gamma-butyrobetaine dioxygenase
VSATCVTEIVALYLRWAGDRYDEQVTQLAHAEQTAALATAAGAAEPLVAAALLHDVGHLLHLATGAPDRHERTGPDYLAGLFPAAVTRPIALHVDAKRYLCAIDPGYHAGLSPGSTASLVRQGGPLAAGEATAFAAEPGIDEAVQLRRWDDQAKLPGLEVAPFADYLPLLAGLARRAAS